MSNSIPAALAASQQVPHSRGQGQAVRTGDVTVTCYDNRIPPFVEAEMDALYGHVNSSLVSLCAHGKAGGASTYVARRGAAPLAILLFRRGAREVSVINEMIRLPAEEIERFARFVFATWPKVSRIAFSLLEQEPRSLPWPSQQHGASEDIVLSLPATPQQYIDSLSYKMRRNIRHYLRIIQRDFPSFDYQVLDAGSITPQLVREVADLSRARIGAKNATFGHSDGEIEALARLAQQRGIAGIVRIDGRVCAGAINSRVGANYFGHMIAHDPRFNKYSLGILCCYLTICAQIERGGKEQHFCYGRYEYKYKLAGVQRDMACLDLYRSRWHYLLAGAAVARRAAASRLAALRGRLLDQEREQGANPGLAARLVKAARRIRRARLVG